MAESDSDDITSLLKARGVGKEKSGGGGGGCGIF